MKVALGEIWNFSEMIDDSEKGWSYELLAGAVHISDISQETLRSLRSDEQYDTELLPEIFTFREIMWQPDVFTDAAQSLPGLRILKSQCEDIISSYAENDQQTVKIYARLIAGIVDACDQSIEAITGEVCTVQKALGTFRMAVFPIIKFFIAHPKNRPDYHKDAVNRLNYAVKIILTQFHGKYTELSDPVWQVTYAHLNCEPNNANEQLMEVEKS